ncbi:MAG: AraC family transcriptional regulator [Christensenella sp.]
MGYTYGKQLKELVYSANFFRKEEFTVVDKNLFASQDSVPLYTLGLNSNCSFPFWIGKNKFSENAKLHQHQYVQINYITKGKGYHVVNNVKTPIQVGDIFVMPPYVPHRIISGEESVAIEVMEIEFLPEFLNEQFSDINNARGMFDFEYISLFLVCENDIRTDLRLSGERQKCVNKIVQSLYEEYQEQKPLFEHAFKALLLQLLVNLSRAFNDSGKSDEHAQAFNNHRRAIENVLEFVDKRFNEDIKIEDVSKVAMMSQTYFCYFFKLLVGKTFTQYLIEKRVENAKEYLTQTDLSVTDIAINSGFNNVSHFIRTFKAMVNLSPIQYRKISNGQE